MSINFQEIIAKLNEFWGNRSCLIVQPYDTEKGAGTMNPHTFLRAIGPEPWSVAYVEPCRRPTDGRYGENPNRFQHYYQYQVLIKPSPNDIQEIYLDSLRALGIKPEDHDRASALGYSYGYFGSVILLLFNIIMINFPDFFGFENSGIGKLQAMKVSFVTVGIWWLLFSQYSF